MSVKERTKWTREWQKMIWSRPKYRWVFGVSFILLLAILGAGIGRPFFLSSQKLQDKILVPIWCLVLSAMLAHVIQFFASKQEMKARIEAARGGKPPHVPRA